MNFNTQYNKIISHLMSEEIKLDLNDINDNRAIIAVYIHCGTNPTASEPIIVDDEYFYRDWDNNFTEYGAHVEHTTENAKIANQVLSDVLDEQGVLYSDEMEQQIESMLSLKGVFRVINDISNANSIMFAVDLDIPAYKQSVIKNTLTTLKDNPNVNALFTRRNT